MTTENRWGRPGFEQQISQVKSFHTLRSATATLSMNTRRRIFAYIQKGGMYTRGTWNGCVMNAASGDQVNSVQEAADYFREPLHVISRFIEAWDGTKGHKTESEANRELEKILLDCGLTTESPQPVEYEKVKVYRVRLFTSKETLLVEELLDEIENGAFDEDFAKFQELVNA